MVGLKCTVNLNSDGSGSFYTGNIVTGMVVLELKREQKVERIDFEVVGTSKAQWTRSKPTIPYIKIYSEEKRLLSVKIKDIFIEVRNGKIMPAGVHRYPFHFSLPEDLPSSFDSGIGNISYYIRIKSKPMYKIKKVVTFSVLSNVNLNHNQDFLMPADFVFQKKISCISGTIQATVRTYKAFAPKQIIPFEIILNNEKQVVISQIRITLVQILRYTVSSGYLDEERKMFHVNHKKKSRNIAELIHFDLDIPDLVPSTVNLVDPMVEVTYAFRVEVIFPFHLTIQEDIPVNVAVIPVVHYKF